MNAPVRPAVALKDLDGAQARRLGTLLDEALDLDPADRPPWLERLAAREPHLAPHVAGLLDAAQPRPGDGETAAFIARRLQRSMAAAPPSIAGRLVGPYRVLGLLGEGGMGSVWRAERADGLFEREVALKLVHPGLTGPALRERFARERRILAALEHPNIARLLDAGVSAEGQPYLAIELIEGTPLDTYCDLARLPLRQRLALMTQVVRAVQHAHQHLVIHRDLKPRNILVGADGRVHLLDFGIAKLLDDGNAAAETELTRLGGRAMTPQYASPEQMAGEPVGTASDVYSLGVVLYELLCGRRPDRDQPQRPSLFAAEQGVARARGATPRQLAHALAGDLDTIALRALKADPSERYPTADSLCQDIERHLAGEPVLARPDSPAYRLRKFVQRHRRRVAAGVAVALLVVAAAGVSLWQAASARQAAAEAAREARRAQAVQAFLLEVFGANSLRQADPQRARQATARELLDAGAARAAETLQASPEAQEAVLDALADLYFQLELFDDAARMRRERIGALERAHGPRDPRVAGAWLAYATDVADTRERAQAAPAIARARELLDAIGDRDSELRGWVAIESARLEQYTSLAAMRRHADEALAQFRARPLRWTNLFHATQIAARARFLGGDAAGAIALHQEAIALARRSESDAPAWLITPWVQMAEAQAERGELRAAEANLREALSAARRLNGETGAASLQTQAKLGALLHRAGRSDEGWALLQQAREMLARPDAKATPDALGAVRRIAGQVATERGDAPLGAELLSAEADELRQQYPGELPLARVLVPLAAALRAVGRLDESAAALDEAARIMGAVASPRVPPMLADPLERERARLAAARDAARLHASSPR